VQHDELRLVAVQFAVLHAPYKLSKCVPCEPKLAALSDPKA
jgi:hypothetical protein